MTELPILPPSFLLGAATAAHQIEGNNLNANVWHDEHATPSIFVEPSGDACDSYHRYREDIALLADAGLDLYRFSVEWARIEPEPGHVSRAELDHYRRIVEACLDRGVTPMVTLHHFTVPEWFARAGAWCSPDAVDVFGRYVEHVVGRLGDVVPWMCTINEANLRTFMQTVGFAPVADSHSVDRLLQGATATGDDRPPMCGLPEPDVALMTSIHTRAMEVVRAGPGSPRVGWTLSLADFQPVDEGVDRCAEMEQRSNLDWLDASAGSDFVGVQTYTRVRVGAGGLLPPPRDALRMQTGWEVYPEALEHTVRSAAARTGLPVFVTEHGIATADDAQRIAHTEAALRGLVRCLDDGIDVRGYAHWTLLDNFEWMAGYKETFGLAAVDRQTFERTPKPSLAWLGRVARARLLSGREGL